ncbi:MAG TPA: hypothetical protein VMH26_19655 [Burkholderiales bacterium]|nr:hypothetical protein [Burkholderiales bacterium]
MTSTTSQSNSVREPTGPRRPLTTGWGRALAAFALASCLSGCAAFRSYDKELNQTTNLAAVGKVDDAIEQLNKDNKGKDKDLLYYLELGMLERLVERYPDSQKAWMSANQTVQAWEHTAQTDPSKLLPGAASYIINDKLRPYEGHDYEKVLLLTYIALNYLALGEYDNARVAIKQTHELEAVIADLRGKELAKVEQDAREKGARTNFKELNGYPVQTIDNPAVNALKNSYQSALSHYLAGFVYEALGEPSLAAPGYRLANELQPNQPLLEEALRGLDQRVSAPDDGLTDVLFVIGSGTAPALESRQFALPVPVNRTLVVVPVSFPVMKATSTPYLPGQLSPGDGQSLTVAPITSIDLMARRALKDDMPGIMLRGAIRSASKAATEYALMHQSQKQNNMGLAIAALAVAIGGVVTESADERTWRTLPSEIGIARGRLPPGTHTISLQTPEGLRSVQLNLTGRYAVVGLRLVRRQLFVMPSEAAFGGSGRQPGNAGVAPGPSTGGGPGTLEQQPQTTETSK